MSWLSEVMSHGVAIALGIGAAIVTLTLVRADRHRKEARERWRG